MSILDKVCSVVFCYHGDEQFLIHELREYLHKCAEASKRNSSKVCNVLLSDWLIAGHVMRSAAFDWTASAARLDPERRPVV